MFNVGVIQAVLRLKDEMSKGLLKSEDALKKTQKSAMMAGAAISAIGVAALALSGKSAAMSADFEKGMREVATISQETADNFGEVSNKVLSLGPELGNVAELTNGLYQAISAGAKDVNAGLLIVEQAAKLAGASLSDTGTTTDALTTVINAYGLEATEAGRVSDVLFNTVRLGKTTMSELAPVIGRVIPTAAALGVEFEDVAGAMSTLTAGGIKTEEAVTSINAVLNTFLKPSAEASDLARSLGFEMGPNFVKSSGGFVGAMQKIQEKTKGSASELATLFPNVRGLKAVLALTGAQAGKFASDVEAMGSAAGVTEAAFAEMQKSASASFDRMKNAASAAMISLGSAVAPVLAKIADAVTVIAGKFNDLSPAMKAIIGVGVGVGGAIATVTGGLVLLLAQLLPTITALGGFRVAALRAATAAKAFTSSLLGRVGLVAAALAAAVAIPKLIDEMAGVTDATKTWATAIGDQIKGNDRAKKSTLSFGEAIRKARTGFTTAEQKVHDMNLALGLLEGTTFASSTRFALLNGELIKVSVSAKRAAPPLKDVDTETGNAGGSASALSVALSKLNVQIALLGPAVKTLLPPWQQFMETFKPKKVADLVPPLTAIEKGMMAFQRQNIVLISPSGIPAVTKATKELHDKVKMLGEPSLFSRIFAGFSNLLSKVSDWAKQMGGKIDKAFGGMFSKLGLDLGSLFGGAIGSGIAAAASFVIGKLVAFLKDIFKKANAADHVREQFGIALTAGMAKAIDDLVKSGVAGDLDAAFRLMLSDAIKGATIQTQADLNKWVALVHQTLSSVDQGTLTSAQAIAAMGKAWLALIPSIKATGSSALVLQKQFSDLLTRFGKTPAVIAAITAAVKAMQAAGITGTKALIDWLKQMGIIIDDTTAKITKAQAAWADWVKNNQSGFTAATRHNRAYFEAIARQMGLSAATAKAWVDGMLKNQREAQRAHEKTVRQSLRQQAKDAGLTGDQIREFIRANLRQMRKDARDAEKQASKDRREAVKKQIADAQLVRDRMNHFINQTGKAWEDMFKRASAAGQKFQDEMIGNSVFPDVAAGATRAAEAVGAQWDGTFGDITMSGERFGVAATSALPAAAPAVAAPASSGPSNAGMEMRLASIEQLLRDQPDTIGNAVKHAVQVEAA